MKPRKLRVFLCHASEDKPVVRKLFSQLIDAGFEPWLDEDALVGGEEWEPTIRRAVNNSDVVLVCLSNRAINKKGFVQKEIRLALDAADYHPDGTTYIIPVRLALCIIPERLSKWHAIDFFDPSDFEQLRRALNTRAVMSNMWATTADSSEAAERDPKTLKKMLKTVDYLMFPTVEEVLEEFEVSVRRLQSEPSHENAMQVCMASRTAYASLYDFRNRDSLKRLNDIFSSCVKAFPKATNNECMRHYIASVKTRAKLTRSLSSKRDFRSRQR